MKDVLRKVRTVAACLPWRVAGSAGLYRPNGAKVQFVIENADWAIRWVGENIARVLNGHSADTIETTTKPYRAYGRVVHFGSQYMWLGWGSHLSRSNAFVTSFFHGKPEDGAEAQRHIEAFLSSAPRLGRIVTGAGIIEQRLLAWGIPRSQLVRIPIGVDTGLFTPVTEEQRRASRASFGIPDDAIVIGSFQKDGVGWGDGMEPKLIKGPDILLKAAEALRKNYPVWVFLTGPARGFVKKGLNDLGIPFVHTYVPSHRELVQCYQALDLYFVTSREEGGPMGLMEAMASGVPVVSSMVGMGPDLITSGVTGELVPVGDVAATVAAAARILELPNRAAGLRLAARDAVGEADWRVVAEAHRDKVYRPLLDELE